MSLPVIDPSTPRAPSEEEWGRLTEAERRAVVEGLPALVPMDLTRRRVIGTRAPTVGP